MSTENYINHPTFGLLYRLCMITEGQELFVTLYAQRLFFTVTVTLPKGVTFDAISRSDARQKFEERMRTVRRQGDYSEYDRLKPIYQQTFQ
ncbi:MAG: PipX family protein [Cyanobacteria bacterium P01_C01_bin.120]